jgi:hypothetical protein
MYQRRCTPLTVSGTFGTIEPRRFGESSQTKRDVSSRVDGIAVKPHSEVNHHLSGRKIFRMVDTYHFFMIEFSKSTVQHRQRALGSESASHTRGSRRQPNSSAGIISGKKLGTAIPM